MKKIIILILAILSLFFIYRLFDNKKVNYVSISDYLFINNNYNNYVYKYLQNKNRLSSFSTHFVNNSISSIYKDLLNNRTIRINNRDYYFKKVLRESNIVVINVGMEEFASNYDKTDMSKNLKTFNSQYDDIVKLIREIRKYAKEKVIFMGYYNPTNYYDARTDELFRNIDLKLGELMHANEVGYIDLYSTIKGSRKNIDKKLASIIEFYME